MDNLDKIKSISEEVGSILEKSKNPDICAAHKLLNARIVDPKSFVTIIGETSTGKSTLINGIFKQEILPTAVHPTTGTVTQLQCTDSDTLRFFAINRDATIEKLNKEQFIYYSKHPDKNLLRLYVELAFPNTDFKGMNIFDTPGFNSIIIEHEEVLREWIPQSDVVIFTVGYRTGFGSEDRELMNLVAEISEADEKLPVLLVINRCPAEATIQDNRIIEIINSVSDSLHRPFKTHLIRSVTPQEGKGEVYPEADELWCEVIHYANSDERKKMIGIKGKACILELIENMRMECENQLSATQLGNNEITELDEKRQEFKKCLEKSYGIVDKYIERLERNLPEIISKRTNELIGSLKSEINNSGKWTEAQICSAFISGHAIPFGARKITCEIEYYKRQLFEEMDEELSEMANKTIYHINNSVNRFPSPEFAKLLSNLANRLGCEFAKRGASSIVRGLGGVGGAAAGTGNLVKIIVSKTGRLVFRKTFSRGVYNQIGKIFTKKMLQRLNIAVSILVDVTSYIWDVHKWRGKLCSEVANSITKWRDDVLAELKSDIMPEYSRTNKKLLNEIYRDFDDEIKRNIESIKEKLSVSQKAELIGYITQLNKYKQKLEVL